MANVHTGAYQKHKLQYYCSTASCNHTRNICALISAYHKGHKKVANVHTQYSTIRKYSTYSQFQNGKCEQPLSFTQNACYIFLLSSRWVLHKRMVSFFVFERSTNSKHFFSGFSDFSANTLWWSRHMIKKWLKKGSQTQILSFPWAFGIQKKPILGSNT